ncbi:hypothetical protein [Paenibacillus sp. XY044]|nr:hypothetical protein [Paenibacillus sp. XY044]
MAHHLERAYFCLSVSTLAALLPLLRKVKMGTLDVGVTLLRA